MTQDIRNQDKSLVSIRGYMTLVINKKTPKPPTLQYVYDYCVAWNV